MSHKFFLGAAIVIGCASFAANGQGTDENQHIMVPSFKAKGQEGNGGFVYKDQEKEKRASRIIDESLDGLSAAVAKTPDSVFSSLTPKVDKTEFLKIIKSVTCLPYMTAYRPLPNGMGLILMMDYKTDSVGTKYVVVYAPMFIALMYMEDEGGAKKFFETQLIHEILHHFSYDEEQADVAAPLIYGKLFPGKKI